MVIARAETYIPLTEAAKSLPPCRAGRPVHVSTFHRWAAVGCRGVKLRTLMIGAVRCTTREWLQQFFEAVTTVADGQIAAPQNDSLARKSRIERAKKRLQAAGV